MHPAFTAITAALIAVVIVSYSITAFSDPGYIPKQGTQSAIDIEAQKLLNEQQNLTRSYCSAFGCCMLLETLQYGSVIDGFGAAVFCDVHRPLQHLAATVYAALSVLQRLRYRGE